MKQGRNAGAKGTLERENLWMLGTLLLESELRNRPARAAREGAFVAALVVAVGGLVAGALALAGG